MPGKVDSRRGLPPQSIWHVQDIVTDEHKLSEYLGKKVKKKNYGKVSMGVVRTTYFIDEHGIIVKANDKVKAADDPGKMLQELSR